MKLQAASAAIALIGGLTIGVNPALASGWQVRADESALQLIGDIAGSAQTAEFKTFSADIDFDPAALGEARVAVDIDLTSISSGDDSYDKDLKSKAWFHAAQTGTATFVSETISAGAPGAYVADGTLTLKGVSMPVSLAFDLAIDGSVATMSGTATVNRLDYGVGAKTAEKWVANAVQVQVNLVADRVE